MYLGLLIITVLVHQASSSLIAVNSGLTVKIGRSAYLDPDQLSFNVAKTREMCKVEVIGDPMTQRVGSLEPKVFDCYFAPKTVQYIHSGSPMLLKDKIKLRVHHFTSKDTQSETFYLNIVIENVSYDVIVREAPLLPVQVENFYGISNAIDHSVIRFRYSQEGNATCTVSFSQYRNSWPMLGHLVKGSSRKPIDALKQDCYDFMFAELQYEHLSPPTPDMDYLPLKVEVYDPEINSEMIVERVYLPIRIKAGFPNVPPKANFMSSYLMDVDEFVLATIQPEVISAKDGETPDSQLVFNLSKPFGANQGFLVNLRDQTEEITAFRQADLENLQIAYRPPNIGAKKREIYEAEFVVLDSHYAVSKPIMLGVAVRPSQTNAPRVSVNKGLTLLEGHVRPITNKNLEIVDHDNLDHVQIIVNGGLKHGRLQVDGKPGILFSVKHLNEGRVTYHHDDSDTVEDSIDLRINDRRNTVRVKFPINILPRDDSSPTLINNVGLDVKEGDTVPITSHILSADDPDSDSRKIIFSLVSPLMAGEILKKYKPSMMGEIIARFSQQELSKGFIYYHHFGGEKFEDVIQFKLRDNQYPPNESGKHSMFVHIQPVSDLPPRIVNGTALRINVTENAVGIITKESLHYTDVETGEENLVYNVTKQPYFFGSRTTENAGHLVNIGNMVMLMKNTSLPAITSFTQNEITHRKIAYMPPDDEIGPKPRRVRFQFLVSDGAGNRLRGNNFDITILPVDNAPPQLETVLVKIKEGHSIILSTNDIRVFDSDSNLNSLVFTLVNPPTHGNITNKGVILKANGQWKRPDLIAREVRYWHDGSETSSDSFTISLSDGQHTVSKEVAIEILPIDDRVPKFVDNLQNPIQVQEKSQVILTTEMLNAIDEDTDDDELVFTVVRPPTFGFFNINYRLGTRFSLRDIKEGRVAFVHQGNEIGAVEKIDTVTFVLSDTEFPSFGNLPLYDMNITILPVDNQGPSVTARKLVVREGQTVSLSQQDLNVVDLDTTQEKLDVIVTEQPEFGFLENIKPDVGSEKSNAGKQIYRFKYSDLLDGHINYVQSTHDGIEPVSDQLKLYATDGTLKSPSVTLSVRIIPENDELPDVMLQDFAVEEGGHKMIDANIFNVNDMDKPKNLVKISVDRPPKHGNLVMMMYSPGHQSMIRLPKHDFTMHDLQRDMRLVYEHDGSENFKDKFTMKISDGKHTVHKTASVTIMPVNDERPEVVKNAGLHIEFGETSLISNVALLAVDGDNTVQEIQYIIKKVPKRGLLQLSGGKSEVTWQNLAPGDHFTQDDVTMNRLQYINTGGMANYGTDKFVFILTDGVHRNPPETFEIEVKNSRKDNIALLNLGLYVVEGERVIISTANLSASDASRRPNEIVFTIIDPPSQGQIELLDQPGIAVTSFTQLDLASQKVVYHHQNPADWTKDLFSFTVSNGIAAVKSGNFIINIQPLDRELPKLIKNNPIQVRAGFNAVLSTDYLSTVDPDTASENITYILLELPSRGKLVKKDAVIRDNFTQYDINEGFVEYQNDQPEARIDRIVFHLTDNKNQGFLVNSTLFMKPVVFSILIQPVDEEPPAVITNQSPDMLEQIAKGKYGFAFTTRHLKAVSPNTEDTKLNFVITKRPKSGSIQTISPRKIRRKFKQHDLMNLNVQYVIEDGALATNDSFMFRVEDSKGNTSPEERFTMSWSVIQFTRAECKLCENVGTLSVSLTRIGAVDKIAFVNIKVKEMSAKVDSDFIPSRAGQIQFDPGMTSATWEVQIIDDGLEEATEKFKLLLKNPVNAVLGENEKLTLVIINADSGTCPQHFGMISRDQPISKGVKPFSVIKTQDQTVLTYHSIVSVSQDSEKKNGIKGKLLDEKRGKNIQRPGGTLIEGIINDEDQEPKQTIQPCNRSTKDLLRLDPNSGQLYVCNGALWVKWRRQSTTKKKGKERKHGIKCSQGWSKYGNKCYKFFGEKKTWNDAQKICQEIHGGNLASVTSKKHSMWLSQLSGRNSGISFWIGLNDKRENNLWEFVSGEPSTFRAWKPGYPKPSRDGEKHCALVNGERRFVNKPCDINKAKYICAQVPSLKTGKIELVE